MRSINDSRYFAEDKSSGTRQCTQSRKNNVSFTQMPSPNGAFELKEHRIVAVKEPRNIDKEEELYIDFSREYSFPEL